MVTVTESRVPVVLFVLATVAIGRPVSGQQLALGPQDPAELEAFIDGLMVAHLDAYESAGAAVSVVKDGELFFSKGYGYADVAARKRVEADETLFRIGSVSKLFVWTAVMQLVEQGRLDLNADINTYLKGFQIPEKYGEPVTMTHLMTHTAGFEDRVIGLFSRNADHLRPLDEVLRRELPARVRPPGVFSSYSNHGTAIAMYVVQCITGTPWEDYIETHMLEPLGMEHTSFSQPLPEALAGDMSKGYRFENGSFKVEGFEYIPLAPVGACSSTAEDMARFMIAHLQLGRFGEHRILEESTAREMQSDLFRHAPAVSPMGHGFIVREMGGQRLVGHGGDTLWFHTMLGLLPEHNLGVFVSHNSAGGAEAAGKFIEQFMERYFGAPEEPAPEPPADFAERAQRFVGVYRSNRYPHSTLAKVAALMGVEVEDSGDGALRFQGKRFIEVAPLTFRQEDGERTVVFREDENGAITHMFVSELPILAFEKVPTWEQARTQAVLFGVCLVFFLAAVIVWPVAAWIRGHYRVVLPPEARLPIGSKLVAWIASALFLVFTGAFAFLMKSPEDIVFGMPPSLETALWLPLVATLFVLASLVYTVALWIGTRGKKLGRIFYTLLTACFVLLLVQLNHWNLLGFYF